MNRHLFPLVHINTVVQTINQHNNHSLSFFHSTTRYQSRNSRLGKTQACSPHVGTRRVPSPRSKPAKSKKELAEFLRNRESENTTEPCRTHAPGTRREQSTEERDEKHRATRPTLRQVRTYLRFLALEDDFLVLPNLSRTPELDCTPPRHLLPQFSRCHGHRPTGCHGQFGLLQPWRATLGVSL